MPANATNAVANSPTSDAPSRAVSAAVAALLPITPRTRSRTNPWPPSFITMLASHPVSRPIAIHVENITAFIVRLLVLRVELSHYICYITNGSLYMKSKSRVLLVLPQEIVDRARVFAGKAMIVLKLPVSLQIVFRALIEHGLKRGGDRALLASVASEATAIHQRRRSRADRTPAERRQPSRPAQPTAR